jgi:PIN domain nuclease of toxin-antitoxin system
MPTATERRRTHAVVLDSSARLALLNGEPGADEVIEALARGARVSSVNYCEVLGKLVDAGVPAADAERALEAARALESALEIVGFDREHARAAAALREATRARGLSLGDRACLALARALGVPAVTADRSWKGLELGVAIRPVR